MSEPSNTGSAQRAQHDADDMGSTVKDDQAAEEHLDDTGEPERDRLGNQEGAS